MRVSKQKDLRVFRSLLCMSGEITT